ncbi:MAG: penicillin-binding transpeptidase domain-containing protein [Chlamydiota bacterium]
MKTDCDIPRKASRLVSFLLVALLLILIRVWYLAVIKHDDYIQSARKPQRRTIITPANRGTVWDRFGLPLAINKVCYDATIVYHEIRDDFPKRRHRKAYLKELTEFLARELEVNPSKVKDLIYGKAAIFPHTPCPIRENISEACYYRLRTLEKNWSGLKMHLCTKRSYPQRKIASHLIGYIGAIDSDQHASIANELKMLREYLQQWEEGLPVPLPKGFTSVVDVQSRYDDLKDKAYTMRAQAGRAGIERTCEERLRGAFGKCELEVGPKGQVIRTLSDGLQALPGERITLTLSAKLQQLAETLLIQSEREREQTFPLAGKNHTAIRPPWIKGGAIVAMIPTTGEIVALASCPRFDPNDFLLSGSCCAQKKAQLNRIHQWLEDRHYRAALWDGTSCLSREISALNRTIDLECAPLSWELYLDQVLSQPSTIRKAFHRLADLSKAIQVLRTIKKMRARSSGAHPPTMAAVIDLLYPDHICCQTKSAHDDSCKLVRDLLVTSKRILDPLLLPIPQNDDKLLFFDLLRLVIDETRFSPALIAKIGTTSLSNYRKLTQAFIVVEQEVKTLAKELYHNHIFPKWRSDHFKSYLKNQREREKTIGTYAHLETEYLQQAENTLFQDFWHLYRWTLIETYLFQQVTTHVKLQPICFQLLLKSKLAPNQSLLLLRETLAPFSREIRLAYLGTMRSITELDLPLWGRYPNLKSLADLATFSYPKHGFGYGKSYAYAHAAAPASLFKVVTGYEALCQSRKRCSGSAPLSSPLNPMTIYDEANPNLITNQGMVLGRTSTGQLITRYYKGGRLPRSYHSMGKVDFETALERSSNLYFSVLAQEILARPSDLQSAAKKFGLGSRTGIELVGEVSGHVPDDLIGNRTGLYATAIGQHTLTATPLQLALMFSAIANREGQVPYAHLVSDSVRANLPPESTLFFPQEIRRTLLTGLERVISNPQGTAHPYRIRKLYLQPSCKQVYTSLQGQWVGKTATAEFTYRPTLDKESKSLLCKDLWFGAIAFEDNQSIPLEERLPEIVVIVYLRFGDYGKEAAPLAAQIIQEWRAIKRANRDTLNPLKGASF